MRGQDRCLGREWVESIDTEAELAKFPSPGRPRQYLNPMPPLSSHDPSKDSTAGSSSCPGLLMITLFSLHGRVPGVSTSSSSSSLLVFVLDEEEPPAVFSFFDDYISKNGGYWGQMRSMNIVRDYYLILDHSVELRTKQNLLL